MRSDKGCSIGQTLAACALLVLSLPAGVRAQPATARDGQHDVEPDRALGRGPVAPSATPRQDSAAVRGQAPFNNQLRKFSDPLNANGAK